MISPHWWNLKRPGCFLPVFFLSFFAGIASGQVPVQEASVAATGGAFVARSGYSCALRNQAGLGWVKEHSVSLNHSLPFIELGISSVSLQANTEKGALGTIFSTYGIPGLRHSSLWLSYGMAISSRLSAGLGMHFWTFSTPEKKFFHPGISFGLGLQVKINEHWICGVHLLNPASWSDTSSDLPNRKMILSIGCSYSFFRTATIFLDLRMAPENRIQWANGIEWSLRKTICFMIGIHNQPYTWSGGFSVEYKQYEIQIALQYLTDTGTIPYASFHYGWQ